MTFFTSYAHYNSQKLLNVTSASHLEHCKRTHKRDLKLISNFTKNLEEYSNPLKMFEMFA